MNYYKAAKYACATGYPILSLQSKEKIDCVTTAFIGLWFKLFFTLLNILIFRPKKGRAWDLLGVVDVNWLPNYAPLVQFG